jgi:hypothetical protein
MARDPFAASRLPDLPNAGYATAREKAVSDMIMQFIRTMERDRIGLLDIVCSGRAKWRSVCARAMRGARMETELVDAIFNYLVLLAGPEPMTQLGNLMKMQTAPPWLGDNAAAYVRPAQVEERVRDSMAFSSAINRGDRNISELKRLK